MKRLGSEKGQTLIMVALSMTLLLGFVAFAIDMGYMFRAQRNLQIAADAAAVAGALDYKYNTSKSSAETAGKAAASSNGVTDGTNGTVTMNCPPLNGSEIGVKTYCEAIVQQPTSVLMNFFHTSSLNVSARAVAGDGVLPGCLWTLSKKGEDIALSGNGSVNISKCEVYDDSNASNALDLSGNGSLSAAGIGIVGNSPGYVDSGNGSINICNPTCKAGKPTVGIAPAASPITPTPPTITPQTANPGTCTGTGPNGVGCNFTCSGNGNCTIGPGTYTSITNSSNGLLTLKPGNYNVTQFITDGGGGISAGAGNLTVGTSITETGNGNLTFGPGDDVINGDLSNSGNGSTSLGAGGSSSNTYTINGCLCSTGNGNLTTGPGSYTIGGNLEDSGNGSANLGAGTYIVEGNVALQGNGGLSATDNTFYIEGGGTSPCTGGGSCVSGNGSMDIEAPTSGPYNGIAFFQSTTDGEPLSISGNGSATFKGIVYAPDAAVAFSGNGNGNSYADFIVDSISFPGNASFQSYQTLNPNALLGKVTIVE